MTTSFNLSNFRQIAWITIGGLILVAVARLAIYGDVSPSASAQSNKANRNEETHSDAAFEASLRKAMDGPVDVFVDAIEVQEGKPLLSGVRFDGLVDVTGKHLLRFTNDKNERWLIDPDTVLMYRILRGKGNK